VSSGISAAVNYVHVVWNSMQRVVHYSYQIDRVKLSGQTGSGRVGSGRVGSRVRSLDLVLSLLDTLPDAADD